MPCGEQRGAQKEHQPVAQPKPGTLRASAKYVDLVPKHGVLDDQVTSGTDHIGCHAHDLAAGGARAEPAPDSSGDISNPICDSGEQGRCHFTFRPRDQVAGTAPDCLKFQLSSRADGPGSQQGVPLCENSCDNLSNLTEVTVRNRSAEALVEVRDSSIHGKGTFALAFLESETPILEYTGELIDRKTAVERDNPDAPDYSWYILQIDDDVFIDARLVEHPAKYINHSCEPNCNLSRDGTRAFVCTLRTIRPGEELTYDYEYDASENLRCRCEARGCRGRI